MAARKTQTAKKTTRKLTPAKKATAKRAPAKKATARKAPARKAVKRGATARKSTAKLSIVKTGPISVGKKAYTKSQFMGCVAEQCGLTKKQVDMVMGSISNVINAHLKKQGPECFSWPGLFKIMVVKKPATAARWGVNPFTGDKMQFKAKPASRRVKVRALKGLKEMAM